MKKALLFAFILLSCVLMLVSCSLGSGDSKKSGTNTGDGGTSVCEHLNEETIKGTPSTCIEKGLSDGVRCADCGEILEEQTELELSSHTEITISGSPATCEDTGLTNGKQCSVCQEILLAQEVIPAKGHVEQTIPGKAATCLKSGISKGIKCTTCKKTLAEQETIPPLGHTFEYESTVEPNCTYIGYDIYKCSNYGCNEEETRNEQPASADAHSFAPYTQPPTCLEAGFEENRCIYCETNDGGEASLIQPMGHTYSRNGYNGEYEYLTTVAPTCISSGEGWIICSECDYCTADDDILNYEYKVTIEPTGEHDFSDETSIYNEIPASCTHGGYTVYKCVGDKECVATLAGTLSEPLGHDYVSKDGLAPTETEQGYTVHEECTRCQEKNGYYIIDTLDTEKNIASHATITSTANWHAFDPSKLVDGNESVGTFSPLWRSYSIYFDYENAIYVSYFNYVCTGKGTLTYGEAVDEITYCQGTCEVIFYDVEGNIISTTGQIDTSTVLNIDATPNAFVKKIEIKYHWASHAGNEYMWEVYVKSPDLINPKEAE